MNTLSLKRKIRARQRALDAGKAFYKRSDELLEEILASGIELGQQIEIGDGQVAELVDNFAKSNKAWKPCGISRFDVKISADTAKL